MRHLALLIGVASAFAPPHAVVARQACVVHGDNECTHEGIDAYAAVQFEQTKPSLRTFLKLWLMGGLDERSQPTASVSTYEPANDTWAAGPALPHPCSGGSAAVLDGEIHFIGDRRHVVLQDGAWAELADGPAPEYTTCQSILLG